MIFNWVVIIGFAVIMVKFVYFYKRIDVLDKKVNDLGIYIIALHVNIRPECIKDPIEGSDNEKKKES